ncbi:hypothetical protein X739_21395 [Mesorhizobium sp. LNHC220B00]|nr:hypothetical protein X739_21395 [Mesorhizobium sp. LNHC220B00]
MGIVGGIGQATALIYLLLPITSATRLASGAAASAPKAARKNRIIPLRKTANAFMDQPSIRQGAVLMSAQLGFVSDCVACAKISS